MQLTDDEWKQKLTPKQYEVLRKKATEAPFSGELLHNESTGMYSCAACGTELFKSDAKFDSGSGWPSFYEAADKGKIELVEDDSHGMSRVEALCSTCGGHLGHVFNDAPQTPTGARYCINSAALKFINKK